MRSIRSDIRPEIRLIGNKNADPEIRLNQPDSALISGLISGLISAPPPGDQAEVLFGSVLSKTNEINLPSKRFKH